jgi:hypothetical protein
MNSGPRGHIPAGGNDHVARHTRAVGHTGALAAELLCGGGRELVTGRGTYSHGRFPVLPRRQLDHAPSQPRARSAEMPSRLELAGIPCLGTAVACGEHAAHESWSGCSPRATLCLGNASPARRAHLDRARGWLGAWSGWRRGRAGKRAWLRHVRRRALSRRTR